MPALKYSERFWWLITKQTNEVTLAVSYDKFPPEEMELLGSNDMHSITWINTHFWVFPVEIPKDILEFNSPLTHSNVPKG